MNTVASWCGTNNCPPEERCDVCALAAELERANEALRQIEAAIKLVPGMWQDVILDAALAEERCPICGGSSFHGHHGTLPGDCGEEQAK